MSVVRLQSAKDFRLDKLSGATLYHTPIDAISRAALGEHWRRLTGGHPGKPQMLDVKGRKLIVPECSMGVARFPFESLCAVPLGANDYLHIAHAFHTVIIDGIPVLDPSRRDVARRFINLVDALYDSPPLISAISFYAVARTFGQKCRVALDGPPNLTTQQGQVTSRTAKSIQECKGRAPAWRAPRSH